LTFGWGVGVFEGPEEGADGGEELGAVRVVKGAAPETDPKRRCQVANGSAESRCRNGARREGRKAA